MAKAKKVFKPIKMRVPGQYDPDAASLEAGTLVTGQTRTQQHQAVDADINTIVKRFKVTGFLPQAARLPSYGDFDSVVDYRTAMDAVVAAEKSFMALPSDMRTKFDNDPQKFLDFVSDKKNLPAMREMGLAKPEDPKPGPLDVRVVADPPAKT